MKRKPLIAIIGVLLLVLVALILVVFTPITGKDQFGPHKKIATGTNPTLDIRYEYDASVLAPGPYDPRGEYPLQLDGDGWGLYGKRIRGLGAMLETKPSGMLFDFVASQHTDTYENWYKFEMLEEHYEDATIQGKLAIHCTWVFERNSDSKDWPGYFPEAVKAGKQVQMEGWAMFSNNDLFYFYTFSPNPIGEANQAVVLEILDSIEFGALLGSDKPIERRTPGRLPDQPEAGTATSAETPTDPATSAENNSQ